MSMSMGSGFYLFFFILIFAAIFYFTVQYFSWKRTRLKRLKKSGGNSLSYTTPTVELRTGETGAMSVRNPDPVKNISAMDEKIFEGNTGGINWKLTSTIPGNVKDQDLRNMTGLWNGKTQWKTENIGWPAGKYLLIMSLPSEIRARQVNMSIFMGRLTRMLIGKVLDMYVGTYFGNEYCAVVEFNEQTKILSNLNIRDFFLLTNDPVPAEKFLDESTQEAIRSWKINPRGFGTEKEVDQFAVLFAPDAMLVSCLTALRKEEEIKMFSDFASAMAVKMKRQLES